MELSHHNNKEALEVMKKACVAPVGKRSRFGGQSSAAEETEEDVPVQQRLYRSTKLWSLYADLEENFGTLTSTRAVYEQMIELKIVTPQVILNYAAMLEEKKYFEESFRAYEKGVAQFGFPHVYHIWAAYLTKFVARYGGTKLERARGTPSPQL